MALLQRLFRTRTRDAGTTTPAPQATPTSNCGTPQSCSYFTFEEHQVRVVLFRECEWRGRKILYDSLAIEKVPVKDGMEVSKRRISVHTKSNESGDQKNNQPSIIEIAEGFAFQYKSDLHDSNILGEMMFGSVAMNHKGMSLKVHILNEPKRLMCTKIFHASNGHRFRRRAVDNLSARNSVSSTTTDCCETASVDSSSIHIKSSFTRPDSSIGSYGLSYDHSLRHSEDLLSVNWNLPKEDSGYCGDYSSSSSVNSTNESFPSMWNRNNLFENSNDLLYFESAQPQEDSTTSYIHRRLHKYLSTTLDKLPLTQKPDLLVTMKNGDYNLGYSSIPGTSDSLSSSSGAVNLRNTKMAVAIIITLSKNNEVEMFEFLMEHALLLENALRRLRLAVQKACREPHLFITNMTKATDETTQWLKDILTGPKINPPLWTSLKASIEQKSSDPLADLFLRDLCLLLKLMDTKDTYFFMSTLITNVLTYHLGWVNFVSPYNIPKQPMELKELLCEKPYNPLWAQLGDLYGAIGSPAKISKTVVYGKENVNIVNKIIFVLSYFIRCSEIKKMTFTSTPISWESIDVYLSKLNSAKNPFQRCGDLPSSDTCNSDTIEMKTFSYKNLERVNNSKSSDTLKGSAILNKSTVTSFKDLDVQESKFIISNKTMCDSLSSRLDKNMDLNSLDSSSTLTVNTKLNECSDINIDKIRSKVNKLCRVPTSTLLYQMQNSEREDICINEKNLLSEAIIQVPQKIECEKQRKSPMFYDSESEKESPDVKDKGVLFTLGDDELLIGLKKKDSLKQHNTKNVINTNDSNNNASSDEIFIKSEKEIIKELEYKQNVVNSEKNKTESDLSSSDESNKSPKPSHTCHKSHCKHSKFNKHSGVKFDFEKYPQIVTNYLKSKNLEILDRHVIGKPGNLKIDSFEFDTTPVIPPFEEDCEKCCTIYEQMLQTPSNASELEYTNDMPEQREIISKKCALPTIIEPIETKDTVQKTFVRRKLENTIIIEPPNKDESNDPKTKPKRKEDVDVDQIYLPLSHILPKPGIQSMKTIGFDRSLMGSVTNHYISDLILQGTVCTGKSWEYQIKRDLSLQSRNASGGAICILADIEDWSVKVYNSNGYMIGGMSALVATMLDSLPYMCHANVPTTQCLAYIESKLRELCIRSKTLAELLMVTEFCDMERLTKTLDLDPNDVPLLLAIASTHSPQVSLKYGISFR